MFDGVKGMPAKVCLGLSALIMFVYALNFIFFADCYTTNKTIAEYNEGVWVATGETCFALFPNNAALDHDSFARGAGVLQLAGTLMFGLFMGNMLILNEGAKGKWSLMIPGFIGFLVMFVVMLMGMDDLPTPIPLYATAAGMILYGAAYYFLKEEGVDEGLTFEVKGLQVKDKITAAMLIIPALIGLIFTINNVLFADGYLGKPNSSIFPLIPAAEAGYYDSEHYAPTSLQVQILGSLFIPYILFAVNVLRTGPAGKWPIMHISMFGLGFFALAGLMFVLSPDKDRWVDGAAADAQLLQNAIISMVVWVLVVAAYVRLRDEGVEDGMTIMGEPAEEGIFLTKMFPAIMVVMTIILFAVRMM